MTKDEDDEIAQAFSDITAQWERGPRLIAIPKEQLDALRAENERLREEVTRLDALIDRGLFAEIERLRAALEAISDLHVDEAGRCFDIADHALNPPA